MENKHPRTIRSEAMSALMEECQVFWAFSNEQFDKGRAKCDLQEGEKLTSIGMGGYMPSKHAERYIHGLRAIGEAFDEAMKDADVRREHIRYELNNHEAFYMHDIESTLDALGEGFTREEVLAVYKHGDRA